MQSDAEDASAARLQNRADTVKRIRAMLGRTQVELSTALGVSVKAVQSYEQGWRSVPVRVMIQLFMLLAIHRRTTDEDLPCWDIRDCPRTAREKCPSYTVGRGQFCWFLSPQHCPPPSDTSASDTLPCMRCPVIRRLLHGRSSTTPRSSPLC